MQGIHVISRCHETTSVQSEHIADRMLDHSGEEQEKLEGLRHHYKHLGHVCLVKEMYATMNKQKAIYDIRMLRLGCEYIYRFRYAISYSMVTLLP